MYCYISFFYTSSNYIMLSSLVEILEIKESKIKFFIIYSTLLSGAVKDIARNILFML